MSTQFQYSHTIQVYKVIFVVREIQPKVWKCKQLVLFLNISTSLLCEAGYWRLGGASSNAWTLGVTKQSLSQVYNMNTRGKQKLSEKIKILTVCCFAPGKNKSLVSVSSIFWQLRERSDGGLRERVTVFLVQCDSRPKGMQENELNFSVFKT